MKITIEQLQAILELKFRSVTKRAKRTVDIVRLSRSLHNKLPRAYISSKTIKRAKIIQIFISNEAH
jgi:hypothetical protein